MEKIVTRIYNGKKYNLHTINGQFHTWSGEMPGTYFSTLQSIRDKKFPDLVELSEHLRLGEYVPEAVRNWLAQYLLGKIKPTKRGRGRPKDEDNPDELIMRALVISRINELKQAGKTLTEALKIIASSKQLAFRNLGVERLKDIYYAGRSEKKRLAKAKKDTAAKRV